MTDIAISVKNVSKRYQVFENQRRRLIHAFWPGSAKGLQEIWALKDIDFEVRRGEAVAIIGRNGGGKSTLLEILTGTLTPTTGTVTINGRVNALLELGSGFNPEYSGRDNVILNGLLLGLSREDILSRFAEIEAFAEIGAAIDRPVKTYSSGMMMRLAFAVQVMTDPDILIIDEALSVGDFFFQQKCMSHIRGLCEKGVTLLFVSHDMGAVRDICQRGILLRKGTIDFDGSNLQAIRRYLNVDKEISPRQIVNEVASVNDCIRASNTLIEQALWQVDEGGVNSSSRNAARIMAVGLYDSQENATTSILMGALAKVKVHLRAFETDVFHVHLEVKNKQNQLLISTGSYNMKISAPEMTAKSDMMFEFDIQLSIEAGEYVFSVSIVQPSSDGTSGVVVDNTPWLGPFNVHWDYKNNRPPFHGMVGMNCTGQFVTK